MLKAPLITPALRAAHEAALSSVRADHLSGGAWKGCRQALGNIQYLHGLAYVLDTRGSTSKMPSSEACTA